jgi:hypothetical protein
MKSIIFHFEKIEELHQPGSADTEVLLFTFPQYQLDDAYHSFHFASDLLFFKNSETMQIVKHLLFENSEKLRKQGITPNKLGKPDMHGIGGAERTLRIAS